MIRALYSSATGMQAQQINIDVIANNMANVSTTGFKKSRANFKDLLYETLRPAGVETANGTITPEGVQVGHGVRPNSVAKIFTQGTLQNTNQELDVAIQGPGFFQIALPDGQIAYTRDGSFGVNANGELLTSDGFLLDPAITLPNDYLSVTISQDGTVAVMLPGDSTQTVVGNIELARFTNPAGLDARLGNNLLLETDASGVPQTGAPLTEGLGQLAQNFLENSNVSVVDEIVSMIQAQRAYEANSKVIQTSDDMLQVATNLKR